MSKTRTFVAIAASADVRERALQAITLLRESADNVKWVAKENLHWTLQFLGEVGDAEVAEVCRRVARVAERFEPFRLDAKGIGAFPKVERPRALWLGAGEGSETLCELQDAIEASLSVIGFRGERRRFVPHLTLGRVGRGNHGGDRLVEKLQTLDRFDGETMQVENVIVYASELEREGPTYHVMARAELGDRE